MRLFQFQGNFDVDIQDAFFFEHGFFFHPRTFWVSYSSLPETFWFFSYYSKGLEIAERLNTINSCNMAHLTIHSGSSGTSEPACKKGFHQHSISTSPFPRPISPLHLRLHIQIHIPIHVHSLQPLSVASQTDQFLHPRLRKMGH